MSYASGSARRRRSTTRKSAPWRTGRPASDNSCPRARMAQDGLERIRSYSAALSAIVPRHSSEPHSQTNTALPASSGPPGNGVVDERNSARRSDGRRRLGDAPFSFIPLRQLGRWRRARPSGSRGLLVVTPRSRQQPKLRRAILLAKLSATLVRTPLCIQLLQLSPEVLCCRPVHACYFADRVARQTWRKAYQGRGVAVRKAPLVLRPHEQSSLARVHVSRRLRTLRGSRRLRTTQPLSSSRRCGPRRLSCEFVDAVPGTRPLSLPPSHEQSNLARAHASRQLRILQRRRRLRTTQPPSSSPHSELGARLPVCRRCPGARPLPLRPSGRVVPAPEGRKTAEEGFRTHRAR